MKICKGTWHYKVWRFTYLFNGKESFKTPDKTNLCRYVNRTIFLPIPIAIAAFCLAAVVLVIVIIGNIFTILSGTGVFAVMNVKDAEGKDQIIWYFPEIKIGARQVPVSNILLPLWGLLFLAAIAYTYWWPAVTTMRPYAGYGAVGLGVLVLAYFLGAIVVDGFRKVGRWDGWKMFKAYLKAKKQGVCPLITFDEA